MIKVIRKDNQLKVQAISSYIHIICSKQNQEKKHRKKTLTITCHTSDSTN